MLSKLIALALVPLALAGCESSDSDIQTGKACLGKNQDTLVESLGTQCQKGDTIGTKNPALFCDFRYAVAFNGFDSAICVYSGRSAEDRVTK